MSSEPHPVAGRAGYGEWIQPDVGGRVRQVVVHGPFVVQRREDLGGGACRLTRHRTAHETTFVVEGYSLRSEIGLPCHVVHLRDEARRGLLCGGHRPLRARPAGGRVPAHVLQRLTPDVIVTIRFLIAHGMCA